MSFFKNKMLATAAVVAEKPNDTGTAVTTTETTSPVAVADPATAYDGEALAAIAQGLGARVSDATESAVETAAKGKEDWQGGPITVLAGLSADFPENDEGKLALSDFPEPGSETGNNPDKFKLPVTDTSGKTSMRPTSFYVRFTAATNHGAAISQEIAYIKRANNLEAVKDGIPAAILEMTSDARDTRLSFLEGRLKTMTTAYRKAMSLHFQLNAVADLTVMVDDTGNVNADPDKNARYKQGTVGVDFHYVTDDNGEDTGEVANRLDPIMIWERPGYDAKGEPRPIKNKMSVSIGSFLKFDAKKAAENGGTYKALLKTVERKPKTPDGSAVTDTPAIKTVDTFVGRFVETFRFMDEMQSATDPKDLGKLYQLLRHKDGKELVVSFVEFRNYLDDVCSELGLNDEYAKLKAAKSPLVSKAA